MKENSSGKYQTSETCGHHMKVKTKAKKKKNKRKFNFNLKLEI